MARQSRWSNFADAFNSVYGVTTQIGRDMETLRVLNKEDWEDEQGNALTGDALQRARYDALAGIEEKYGTAKGALDIRSGFEDYNTKSMNNRLLEDTYDERVWQQGIGASGEIRSRTALNSANAGLASARTRGVNLENDYNAGTLESRIAARRAADEAATARDTGQTTAYRDPSYVESLVNTQRQTSTEAALAAQRGLQTKAAEAQPSYVTAFNDETVTSAQTRAAQARTGLANATTDLQVAQTPEYQTNRQGVAMEESRTGLATAESDRLAAERRLEANRFYTEWAQTADPDNPESMPSLIRGIKAVDPAAGMDLEKNYGEHELWRITNDSIRYKAEANTVLSQQGLEGLREWIDSSNGNDGVVVEGDDDGGPIRLIETNPDGSVKRVIAEGRDGREFRENLQGYLDPANMLAISKQQYDNLLTAAQAEFAQAQAQAKGTLSLDNFIAGRLSENPQDPLALALAFRTNPEAFEQYNEMLQVQGLISAAGGNPSAVPNPLGGENAQATPEDQVLADPASAPGATTDPLAAANSVLDSFNAHTQDMDVDQRAAFISKNRELLEKYNLYQPELVKIAAAKDMAGAIKRQTVAEFLGELSAFVSAEPVRGIGAKADNANRQRAAAQLQAIQENPEILQIVLRDMRTALEAAQQRAGSGGYTGVNAGRNVQAYEQRIQELEALIQQMQQN
jgi:hypothetical protein